MIYINYGMPRSGSTFLWKAVEQMLLQQDDVSSVFVTDVADFDLNTDYTTVIKTHGAITEKVIGEVERGRVKVFASYRNAIEAAASRRNMEHDSRFGDVSFLESFKKTLVAIDRLREWLDVAAIAVRYDRIGDRGTLMDVANALNLQCNVDIVSQTLANELPTLEWSPGKKFQGVLPYWESAVPDWFRQLQAMDS